MMSPARLPPRLDRIQRATSGGPSLVTCPDIDGLKAVQAGGASANAVTSPIPFVPVRYDDRGRHSASQRHARSFAICLVILSRCRSSL